MKPFCELTVQEIFPAVRALIAMELMKGLGYTQEEAAAKMGVTQPAVSQYIKACRGKKARLLKADSYMHAFIKSSARRLAKAENIYKSTIMCDICKEVRRTGLLCKFHREAIPALKNCNICLEGDVCR